MSSLPLIFIWLDKRIGKLPGGNEKLKEKFRKILSPIRQFDKPTFCLDFIEESLKDKRVVFLTSHIFADELFLNKIASLANVCRIYVYDQQGKEYRIDDTDLKKKMGPERVIQFDERLYEHLIMDLIDIYSNESNRLENDEQSKEAKELLESAVKLLDTIDDKDEDVEKIENNLIYRIHRLK